MKYFRVLPAFFLLFLILENTHAQEKFNENQKEPVQESIEEPPKENAEDESNDLQSNMTRWQMLKYDGVSAFGGLKHAYTQPFRWKGKDWATFGGIVAGTTLLYLIDEPANDFFTDQRDDVPDFIRETGFRFGKPLVNYGLTTGIYAFGLITKNEKVRKTGVLLIASATAGGIIQTVSKTLVGRARPHTGKGKDAFKFYSSEADYHSFPSGHAILSFTTAYAISKQFKNPYIKGGIYALGLISPVSRLWEGAHWLTDVTLGIVLSVVIVDGIDNYLNKKERYVYDSKKFKIKWDLRLGAGQLGVIGRF
ncbi:phosphatase PAP2 family protein [Aquimarina sp. AD1]|uniref:phosphatase PAP2 family protein n=1 Tax=Aquimarina sp. (strain AD1) TaxID=1714848 RepID=UPI000E53CC32|nr:phosphatase PAP2 family protein [Aquimarina sp. AD1]AXT56841.1 phosphatase PAP2 family protein [Aquimarina sp. AD1]RKN35895.1 phosphatase PAP2 family protein [Aquimarina sp. AD1]